MRKKSQQQNEGGKAPDSGSDLGEREEQVTCYASALLLTMTDEACREVEM